MKLRLLTLLIVMVCFTSCSTDEVITNETSGTELNTKRQDPGDPLELGLPKYYITYSKNAMDNNLKDEIRSYFFNKYPFVSYETTNLPEVEIWYGDVTVPDIKPSAQGDVEQHKDTSASQVPPPGI